MSFKKKSPEQSEHNRKKGRFSPAFFLTLSAGILMIPSLLLPPEGAVKSGDSLFLILGWFFLLGTAVGLKVFSSYRASKGNPEKKTIPGHRCIFTSADLFAAVFFGWISLSWFHLIITEGGNRLLGANGFWVFALMPIIYTVFRFTPSQYRSTLEKLLFAAILGSAFFETSLSLYSYYVTAPATREQFAEDPESLLRENGLTLEKGSPEYLLFEKRILNSTEPLGSFGMANTLAGFLVPIFVLLSALFFSALSKRNRIEISAIRLFWLFIFGGGIGFTLLLTKSRSGYLAALTGVLAAGILIFCRQDTGFTARKKIFSRYNSKSTFYTAACVTAAFILLMGISFHAGWIDKEVFSEAKKSLGYRFDYWTAAAQMIADHPILGIGPGNFQTTYTRYILPTASETVADPHNFAFELASLFGIPALLLFTAFLFCVCRQVFQTQGQVQDKSSPLYLETFLLFTGGYVLYAVLNPLTSAPTDHSFVAGFAPVFLVISFAAAALASGICRLPVQIFLIALISEILNLSAAGGIGFTATAFQVWGLSIVILNRSKETRSPSPFLSSQKTQAAAAAVTAAFFILFLITDFFPNLAEKKVLRLASELPPSALKPVLAETLQGIGHDSIPLSFLQCEITMDEKARIHSAAKTEEWNNSKKRLFQTAPGSASIRTDLGNREYALYQQTHQREFLDAAVESFSESALLFPTDASAHARLAVVLNAAKRKSEAEKEKTKALSLDEQTPHEDRKIPAHLKKELTRIN